MNEKKPLYKRKKFWKWTGITLLALFVIGTISDMTGYSDKMEAEKAAEQAEREAQKADEALKRDLVKSAEKVEKAAAKEAKANAEKVEAEQSTPKTLADAVIEHLGDGRLIGQSVKDGYYTIETDFGRFIGREYCEEESIELAQLVSEHPNYADTGAKGVMVVYISGVTDVYGTSTNETIMFVGYSNETIAKINFDKFNTDNVVTVADEYYRMASFK